jgi:hypothetical protein
MDCTDFRRVEQELQQKLHPVPALHTQSLQCTQGWSTASLGEVADYMLFFKQINLLVFAPMFWKSKRR